MNTSPFNTDTSRLALPAVRPASSHMHRSILHRNILFYSILLQSMCLINILMPLVCLCMFISCALVAGEARIKMCAGKISSCKLWEHRHQNEQSLSPFTCLCSAAQHILRWAIPDIWLYSMHNHHISSVIDCLHLSGSAYTLWVFSRWSWFALYILIHLFPPLMFCSLSDRLAEFAINTPV